MRSLRFSLSFLLALAVIAAVGVLLISWPGAGAAVDTDGDGYDDALEAYLTTDPLSDCGPVSATDAWPPDFNQDGVINISDLITLMPPNFGHRDGDPGFAERRDLNWDGINGALDMAHLMVPMFGTFCPSPYVPPPAAGSISEVAIDMDTTGNDARLTQGADIQNCGVISSGGTNTIDLDIVIPSPGVDASDGIEAWEFLLEYDPAVVSVSVEDQNYLLAQAAGSALASGLSDSLPDAGGSWRSGGLDAPSGIGASDPEPVGPHEVGPGVLTRITLTGGLPGLTALTLTKVGAMTAGNAAIPITTVTNAWVSVDQACAPPATADVSVSSVTTTAPAGGSMGVAFTVDADVTVSVAPGGLDPVNVDTAITLNMPADCSTGSANPANVLGTSVSVAGSPVLINPPSPSASWSVTCTAPSFHDFTTTATATAPGVTDPNLANNTLTSAIDTTAVTGDADVKVTDVTIAGVDTDGDTTVDIPIGNLTSIVSDDGYDNDADTLVDEDPIDGIDNDADTSIDEDGGEELLMVVEKTLHNNGPDGPVEVSITDAGTGIVATGLPGPAGLVPANCTLVFDSGPATATLPASVPVTVTEKYALHCGLSPFQNVNDDFPADLEFDEDPIGGAGVDADGDTLIDEDACDTVDNDGDLLIDEDDPAGDNDCDGAIDEDPSYEVVAMLYVESIDPTDPHVTDTDPGNNSGFDSAAFPALLPSSPTVTVTIDDKASPGSIGHTFPASSGDPPAADDCLIVSACEMLAYLDEPGGNPLHGARTNVPNPDGVRRGTGFYIADGLATLDPVPVPIPSTTLMADIAYWANVDLGAGCNVPVGNNVPLYDGSLPGVGSLFFNGSLFEGPNDGTAAALSDPTVWPTRLESDRQLARLVGLGGVVWARYVGFDVIVGFPINIVVVNLGTGGFEHVYVRGDPTTPDGIIWCTPFTAEVDYLGETAGGEVLRVCDEVGTHTLATTFTRRDIGYTSTVGDTVACSGQLALFSARAPDIVSPGCEPAALLKVPDIGGAPCPRVGPPLDPDLYFSPTIFFGLNRGGDVDDLDAISLTELSGLPEPAFHFSVDSTSSGVAACAAPDVFSEATAGGGPEAHGDIFTDLNVSGCNALYQDETVQGLNAPGGAPLDDLDALTEPPIVWGPCWDTTAGVAIPCPAFSVAATSDILGSPDGLGINIIGPADLLVPPNTPQNDFMAGPCPAGGAPCVAVPATQLKLDPTDDLDALCWFDRNGNGLPDLPVAAGGPDPDQYYFSLDTGSFTLTTRSLSAADILAPWPAGVILAVFSERLGLEQTDNMDALKCLDPDSDGDNWRDAEEEDQCVFTATGWWVAPGDSDCDGYTDADEALITTDPGDRCADDPADDAWPPDFDMNTVLNVVDLAQVLPPFFGSSAVGGPPFTVRADLAPDNVINITDVFKELPPMFGRSCTED